MSQHAASRCALAAWACYLMAACCTSAQHPLLPKRVRSPSAPAALDFTASMTLYSEAAWATVPRYVFPCYSGREFNATELKYLASFPLVVLCHTYRTADNHTLFAEDAMALTAKKIKSISPSTGVLFYINSALDYQDYAYHHKLLERPDLWLRWGPGKNAGVPYYINCIGCPITDFASQAGRDFFITEYINATKAHGPPVFAGLFADRASGAPKGCANETVSRSHARTCILLISTDFDHWQFSACPSANYGAY
jgi:hypothetical protein